MSGYAVEPKRQAPMPSPEPPATPSPTPAAATAPAAGKPRRTLPLRAWYLIAGLGIGVLWAWHSGESPVQSLLRLVITVLVVRSLLAVIQYVARRAGRPTGPALHTGWLLVAKGSLIMGAFVLTEILVTAGVGSANVIVGALIVVVVTAFGPRLHPRLFGSPAATTTRTSAAQAAPPQTAPAPTATPDPRTTPDHAPTPTPRTPRLRRQGRTPAPGRDTV
ncbi:hypothetical protein [Streptomyces sp. NPDC050560]|uniref:hypothetical protein n=1 Tax=Streptomyces sp. NPDC050560 TaxID=3365630 RepID=UPI003787F5B7